MKSILTGMCVALGLSAVAFAQQTPSSTTTQQPETSTQQPAETTRQPSTTTTQQPATATQTAQGSQAGEQVTVTGCVQREEDYRRAQGAGGGGVAGTGVGAGNEFILAEVSMSGAGSSTTASAGAAQSTAGEGSSAATGTSGTAGAAGTSGSASRAMAYELSGPNEGKVGQFVGRRVEISGRLKAAEVGAGGATGGPTAGAPPRGVDVLSQDLQIRELDVASVRETTGTCAPAR